MTPRKQYFVSLAAFLFAVGACALLGHVTGSRFFVFPLLVAFFVFTIWNLAFCCRKCGTPYLYEFKGHFMFPTVLPKKCRTCGWPTNQRYGGEHEKTRR